MTPDNTMVIGDDGVRFDVPLRAADRARMDAVVADQRRLAAGLGRFRAGVEPQWMDLGFAHVMGTCRMGPADDGTSVTDGFGQVWGTARPLPRHSRSDPNRSGGQPDPDRGGTGDSQR